MRRREGNMYQSAMTPYLRFSSEPSPGCAP
jgi:hypothetical protein